MGNGLALGIILAFAAAFGFGLNQIFVRLATQGISGPATAFFAVTTGAVIAGALALIFNLRDFGHLPLIAFAWFLLLAAVHGPLARSFNFTAISMIGATRAAPVQSFAPIFSAAIAIVLLHERPSLLLYLGSLIVVGGMTLVVTGGMRGRRDESQAAFNNIGYLFAFVAAAGFGAVTVIVKYINTEFAPPLVTVTFSLSIGSILLAGLTHRQLVSSFNESRRAHIRWSVIAGCCSGLGAISLFSALGRAPVTVVAPIAFAAPLVSLMASHLFLRRLERINRPIVAGTVVAVSGIVLIVLGRA